MASQKEADGSKEDSEGTNHQANQTDPANQADSTGETNCTDWA